LKEDELANGLRKAVLNQKLFPVFACAALKDLGSRHWLKALSAFSLLPADKPVLDSEGQPFDPSPEAPVTGFVWRTVNDPFVGQLTFLRVCGGTLRSDSELLNATKDHKERIATFFEVNGQEAATGSEAHAGDVVALTKLKHTGLGDLLCAPSRKGHRSRRSSFRIPWRLCCEGEDAGG